MISEAAVSFDSWIRSQAWRRYLIWPLVLIGITLILVFVTFVGLRLSGNELLLYQECARKLRHERKYSEIFQDGFWSLQSNDRLNRAKLAIENSHVDDRFSDGLLDDGFLYHNLSRFIRSYAVMERVFKIYVYSEGYKPLIHEGPTTGIYASEGLFISAIERDNMFTVRDPRLATMFYIPFSLKKMVDHMFDPDSHSMKNIQIYIANYVNRLAMKHPFLNRTNGADHFFVSCHDWALQALERHEQLRNNVVKVVCNADSSRGFKLNQDVSLPETRIAPRKKSFNETAVSSTRLRNHRPYLAFFAGQMHGPLRPLLLKHWKDKDPSMKIYEVLPPAVAEKISYAQHMRLSRYCICAAGFEVNSPRLVESIMEECVPVIIADNFVLPFAEAINWRSISVTVAEKDVPQLKRILGRISERRYWEMQARLKFVKRHFEWSSEAPRKYDIFNMIIHSLWMQQLNNTTGN